MKVERSDPGPSDNLRWLGSWYASQCEGDWEHQYGVRIDTLDNPGWTVRIDLAGTALEGRTMDEVKIDYEDDCAWAVCTVRASTFEAACGPLMLHAACGVFRSWAQSQKSKDSPDE